MNAILSKNLNTLPVLHALLVEGSVVGAAGRVGLSQPTVSGILAKLRVEFGDPLLVRVGRGMRLTPRAERLLPVVAALCRDLESLYAPEEFDPATLTRTFVIAAPDHLAFLLTPSLLALAGTEAPDIRLRFVHVPTDLDRYVLDDAVDVAVCANFDLWPALRYRHLFSERMVAAMWCEHPLARQPQVTAEQVRRYPNSTMNSGTVTSARSPRIRTGVPSLDTAHRVSLSRFVDAILLTVGTDIVAAAPEALVRHLAATVPVVGVPLAEPDTVQGGMFWAPAHDHDVEMIWLRSLVERAAVKLQ